MTFEPDRGGFNNIRYSIVCYVVSPGVACMHGFHQSYFLNVNTYWRHEVQTDVLHLLSEWLI